MHVNTEGIDKAIFFILQHFAQMNCTVCNFSVVFNNGSILQCCEIQGQLWQTLIAPQPIIFKYHTYLLKSHSYYVRGAVKKFLELWYSTAMVGHENAYLITFKVGPLPKVTRDEIRRLGWMGDERNVFFFG
jgi:hypothetical protein